jgi:hypothetical protein
VLGRVGGIQMPGNLVERSSSIFLHLPYHPQSHEKDAQFVGRSVTMGGHKV